MPVFRKKNEYFFKNWSREMAYVLGFFAADGSMYKTKRGAYFIDFNSTDRQILLKIRKCFGSNHKISVRIYKSPKWKPSHRLQIGSKMIFHDLLLLGMVRAKSKILKFPRVQHRYLPDFIRGYFDGDGCARLGRYWNKNRKKWRRQFSVSFVSGSRRFLVGLWKALKNKTYGGRIGKKKGGYELVFSSRDGIALFHFMYHNETAGLFLERKRNIFLKALNILEMRA